MTILFFIEKGEKNSLKRFFFKYRLINLYFVPFYFAISLNAYAQVNGTANFDTITPPPSSVTFTNGNSATVSISGSVVATDPPDAVTSVQVKDGNVVLASQRWQARLDTKTEVPQNDGRAFNFSFSLGVGDHILTISASNYNGGGGSLSFPITVHSSSADAAAAAQAKTAQIMSLITNLLLSDDDSTAQPTGNGPLPTVTVQRTPFPLVAGQPFTTTWSTENATSLSRTCTSSGGGFTDNLTLATSGSATATADAAWLGYPSTCTWTVSGLGGSDTYVETVKTIVTIPGSGAAAMCR